MGDQKPTALRRDIYQGNPDLIVMGTYGRTGLSHVLLGGVAEHVGQLELYKLLTVRWGEDGAESRAAHVRY